MPETCDHWFMADTFKTVPPLDEQLYTIHRLVDGKVIPAVYYAPLPHKQTVTFSCLFTALLTHNMDLPSQWT